MRPKAASNPLLPALRRCASILVLFAFLPSPARAAGPLQSAVQHIPSAVRSRPLGRLAGTNRLDLEISLPLRNRETLTNLLRDIYDPSSPNYHHYVTPDQFARQFGPTEQDYQALAAFVRARGLTVTGTHPNRTLLNVSGTAAEVGRAFRVNLRLYRHPTEGRQFYAPDAEPALDLVVPVLAIGGLDNYVLPRPMNLQRAAFDQPNTPQANGSADAPPDATPDATGTGPRGNFIGRDFRAAYAPGVALTGAGQSVGLVEFDNYYPNDITIYENLAGLPTVALTNVLLFGAGGKPGGNNLEVALDIDMAVSMAPGLSQVLVYEGTTGDSILNRMATDNLARQLSCSWNFGPLVDATREQIFQQFMAQGQTMFVAAGDNGAFAGTVPSPSDDPLVTVVGGTSLTTGPGGAWVSETVWPGTGGGISTAFPIPAWQQGISMSSNQGSATMRNVPDVACLADSVIWLVGNDGQQAPIGGTSAAAPLWAGFAALANQQAALNAKPGIGFLNPSLSLIGHAANYRLNFHDITTGNNTNGVSPNKFFAVPGYDLCTGWGTPAGSNLINALVWPPDDLLIFPPLSVTAVGPAGGPFAPASQNYLMTVPLQDSPLNWSTSNSASWLTVSPANGTTPSPSPLANVSLNSAASNLPAGSYTATVWFTNLSDNFVQSRQFTLDVITPPLITAQPSNQTVLPGGSAVFNVGTAGNAQLFFQWEKNGTNLSNGGNVFGANTSRLTLTQITAADMGTYSVIVSNQLKAVASSNAVLIVPSPGTPGIAMSTLYQFTGDNDGGNPNALIQGSDGNFYGTTQTGGSNLAGTVFRMPPGGVPAGLYSFTGGADGARPQSALTRGADGNFYGTAFGGGDSDNGTVYKITTNGSFFRLVTFNLTNGDLPFAGLTLARDGNFYGATYQGGASGHGSVYQLATNGAEPLLYSFTGGTDGGFPRGGLTQGLDGNIYGTTFTGGALNLGTVFRVTTNGVLTTLVTFNGTNGSLPYAGLVPDESGNFFGVTGAGGSFSNGTVFEITASGVFSNLYSFTGGNDGAQPSGGLVEGLDGNFYGTTAYGGAYGVGTVFRMLPNGTLTTIAQFNGFNGANPSAALLPAADGSLYGTTQNGGAGGAGVIYRLNLTEGPVQFTSQPASQSAFTGANVFLSAAAVGTPPITWQWTANGTNLSDGGNLSGSTTRVLAITNANAVDAAIYALVASNSFGAVTSHTAFLQIVVSPPVFTTQPTNLTLSPGATATFTAAAVGSQPITYHWQKNGTYLADGNNVSGSLSGVLTVSNVTELDSGTYTLVAGNFISPVPSTGAVLTVVPVSATGTSFATLHSFTGGTDGAKPSGLTLATDGNLYGTTEFGGTQHRGAVFRVSTNGTVTNVASFTTQGSAPIGGVTQALDGNFYGTTLFGGSNGVGAVFMMTSNGVLTNLYSFTGGTDGNAPIGPLLRGADGNFYGTTQYGGNFLSGNVFRLTPGGVVSNVYSFAADANGGYPTNALMQGTDGNFYGVTQNDALQSSGTIFRLTPAGILTTLYAFANSGVNGQLPNGPLVVGDDGSFYGTAQHNTFHNIPFYGTIFKLTTNNSLSTLYMLNTSDGHYPSAGLILGNDGNFYGTAEFGGTVGNNGTAFAVTPNGSITTLVNFDGFDEGAHPETPLTVGADGNLYGTTSTGGTGGQGNVFRLSFTNAPQIITPPVAVTAYIGGTARFSVGVTGASPLFWQWQKNGTNLASGNFTGATGRVLTLTNLTTNNAGNYSVIVSNGLGSMTTTPVMLTVLSSGPILVSSPAPLTLPAGATATFNVSATGNQPLYYQWQKNSTNLSDGGNVTGSATSSLTIANVSPADAATYSVIISNAITSISGGGAALTVISVTASNTTLSRLYSFTGNNDGAGPNGLVQASNGVFYGTTRIGGAYGAGTLFQMTTNFVVTGLYSFTGGADGANPLSTLTPGPDGSFYGTTDDGGQGLGTVFMLSTNGVFSNLYSFGGGNDGAFPTAGLTLGPDGNFYGTTTSGGSNSFGTLYQMTPGGAVTGLYSFTGGADGGQPQGPLVLALGNFYGVTSVGGSNSAGTLFLLSTNGTFTNLHSFDPVLEGSSPNGLASTISPFSQPSGGGRGGGGAMHLYGTTSHGGTFSNGTAFRAELDGTVTTYYSFSGLTNSTNADGANPESSLLIGNDGRLYGATANGGPYGLGNLFWMPPLPINTNGPGGFATPELTTNVPPITLAWFDGPNGAHPTTPLMQAMDGYFYGSTSAGGLNNQGVIFRLGAAASPNLFFPIQSNGFFSFAWTATPGRNYLVEYSTNLAVPSWQNLGTAFAATNLFMTTFDPAPASPQRYYRVLLLP